MSELKVIDRRKDRNAGWMPRRNMSAAANDSVVRICIDEIPRLLPGYLFAFLREEDNRYRFIAVQAVHRGENLYVAPNGAPIYRPVPRVYHTYPFVLHTRQEEGNVTGTLLFDHSSGLYRESPDTPEGERRFFDEEGKVDPELQRLTDYLVDTKKWLDITQKATDALAEAKLLVPWNLGIESLEKDRPVLGGFYRVDLSRLNGLEDVTLAELAKSQALTLAYAQNFSMPRVETLRTLYRRRHEEKKSATANVNDVDVEAFFSGGDDTIAFDWSKL